MRRRLLATALFLATACAVACGRSGADFLDDGATASPTPTLSPTPTGTATPVCDPCRPAKGDLVVSEVFVRDLGGNVSNANLSSASSGGDDRFVELLNVSARAVDLGGVEIRVANDVSDTPFVWHLFQAGQILPPGKARVVFNERGIVDLGPLRALVGSGATIELANATGDLSATGDLGNAGFRVEIRDDDGILLFFLVVDRNLGEVVDVTRGIEPGAAQSDTIAVDPDPCDFSGSCSGLYSIALDSALPWTIDAPYADHRVLATQGTCDETNADFPCCAFSPGRHATNEGGSFRVCRNY